MPQDTIRPLKSGYFVILNEGYYLYLIDITKLLTSRRMTLMEPTRL